MKKIAFLMAFLFTGAQATTQNLTISGTISSMCLFSSVQNGTFGYDPSAPDYLNTASTGGTPATFTVTYNGTPTVSITEITSFTIKPAGYTNSPTFTNTLTNTNSGALTYPSGVASYTQTGGQQDTFTLHLRVANGQAFPLGQYTGSTTVTCQ